MKIRGAVRAALVTLAVLMLLVPMSAGAGPDPDPNAMCGGTAPAVTSCTTGTHVTASRGYLGLNIMTVPGYVGVVSTRITWTNVQGASGRYVLTCDFPGLVDDDPVFGECVNNGGQFPPPNVQATITHQCFSYNRPLTNPPTPGGSGEWRCRFGHF